MELRFDGEIVHWRGPAPHHFVAVPPALCAATWRARVLKELQPRVTLLIGGHAIRWHLGLRGVTAAVAGWRDHAPRVFPLPHPSWRNTAWLKRNPWFEAELVPELRRTLAEVL